MRGVVLPLTLDQRAQRARYLAGEVTIDSLDEFVRKAGAPQLCPSLTYRLKVFNGGKDPTAPDPSTGALGFRFCDCAGGACWCQGVDRYNEEQFPEYRGWQNTDSILIESRRKTPRCWIRIKEPRAGDVVVCASGSPGHKIGHVGTITGYKLNHFDVTDRDCWELIEVVDVAGRSGRANRRTTARGWFGTGGSFLRCIMVPPTLTLGARGQFVSWLQRRLTGLKDDGALGPITAAAVAAYQRNAKLPVTGSVTPDTWRALTGVMPS